jgi:hypothetical protein
VARDSAWQLDHSDETTSAFVDCYLARAAAEADPVARARLMAEARRLDHRSAALIAAAAPLAVTLERLGDDAAAKEDWETAFDAYLWAVKIEPQRSWTRRKAEEARDKRLGIRGKEPESARKTPTTPRRSATP